MAYSKEQLLAEAKRRYPIGTKFKCAHGNIDDRNDNKSIRSINGVFTVVEHKILNDGIHSGNGWIVLRDKWAEIISQEVSLNINYLIL